MRQSGRTTRAIKNLTMGHPDAGVMIYVMTGTNQIDAFLRREGELQNFLNSSRKKGRYSFVLSEGRDLHFAAFHSNNLGMRGLVAIDHAVYEVRYEKGYSSFERQLDSWRYVNGGGNLL